MLMKTKHITKNLLLAVVPIIIYNLSNLAIGILFYVIFPESYVDNNYYMMDSLFCLLIMIPFSIWFYRIVRRRENAAEKKTEISHMPLKIVIIVLGMGGISTLWFMIAENMLQSVTLIADSMQSFDETWSTIGAEPYLYVLLSVVVLGPIVEELMFRGIMFHYLAKIKAGWFPVVISGIAFGLWHGEPVQVVYTALMGVMMGAVYLVVRDLRVPIAIHVLNNFLSALPPAIDLPAIQNIIFYASLIMIIPTVYILTDMLKKDQAAALMQRVSNPDSGN